MACITPSKVKPSNIGRQGLSSRIPRYVNRSSTDNAAVMISTTAVSVLKRAESKFKSKDNMNYKLLLDAYLEFIIVSDQFNSGEDE